MSASEFQEALKGAIMMNVYNKRSAASAHLCSAWGQAVDVSVYGFGSRLLPGKNENLNFKLLKLWVVIGNYITVLLPVKVMIT